MKLFIKSVCRGGMSTLNKPGLVSGCDAGLYRITGAISTINVVSKRTVPAINLSRASETLTEIIINVAGSVYYLNR